MKINLSAIAHKNDDDKSPSTEQNKNLVSEVKTEEILVPKISLSSIKKNQSSDEKVVENINPPLIPTLTPTSNQEEENSNKIDEKPIEKVVEKISLMPKISLGSIKKSKTPDEIIEENEINREIEHKEKKEELLEIMEDETITNFPSENTQINKTEWWIAIENNTINEIKEKNVENYSNENTKWEVDIAEIEKKINEKVEEEVNKKINKWVIPITNEVVTGEPVEIFWNYKSEFTKKEDIIIEKVVQEKKRFREKLKEPKTRMLLILWLLLMTIVTVSALFILDPKNNSYEKYKASIINNVKNLKENYISNEWKLETISIENYKFDLYTQKKNSWSTSYKYNDIIYTNKTELDKIINSEVNILKKEDAIKRIEEMKKESERKKIEQDRIEQERINQEKIQQGTIETWTGTSEIQKTDAEKAEELRLNSEKEALRLEQFNKIKNVIHNKYRDIFSTK